MAGLHLYWKMTPAQLFCKFYEIFMNNFLTERFRAAASEIAKNIP